LSFVCPTGSDRSSSRSRTEAFTASSVARRFAPASPSGGSGFVDPGVARARPRTARRASARATRQGDPYTEDPHPHDLPGSHGSPGAGVTTRVDREAAVRKRLLAELLEILHDARERRAPWYVDALETARAGRARLRRSLPPGTDEQDSGKDAGRAEPRVGRGSRAGCGTKDRGSSPSISVPEIATPPRALRAREGAAL
jgi:hypothetical protein